MLTEDELRVKVSELVAYARDHISMNDADRIYVTNILLDFSISPAPFALLISTELPIPTRSPTKHASAKRGLMTAIAAAPTGPHDCPTAIVSTKL